MMDNYQDSICLLEKAVACETDDGQLPINLPFWFLKDITQDFSPDQQIGSGGFAYVYKGTLPNGRMVAVKRLHNKIEIQKEDFQREVACLREVKHKNIVRFLGYCFETQQIPKLYQGRYVWADMRYMLFCFEFLSKGSLAKCDTGPSSGLRWELHYRIIKGICEGLAYLRQQRIIHMDLKPDNILLDYSMVPMIADFGLSRRFSGNHSKIITENIVGSRGYMAPEFLNSGTITFKTDIYSLGVIIIEVLMGCKEECPNVDKVLESRTNTIGISKSGPLLEQVKLCAEIGIDCIHDDPNKRPDIQDIVSRLNETDVSMQLRRFYRYYRQAKQGCKPMRITASMAPELRPYWLSESALLDVEPLELCFPFKAKNVAHCSLRLINRTDCYFAYFIRPQFQAMYTIDRHIYCLDPMSTCILNVKMVQQEIRPPIIDMGMIEILMISLESKRDLLSLKSFIGEDSQKIDGHLLKRAEELGGDEVHAAMLTAVVCPPRDAALKCPPTPRDAAPEVISRVSFMDIQTIDVLYSIIPGILVGYGNRVSIWWYEAKVNIVSALWLLFNIIGNRQAKQAVTTFHINGMMNGHARVTSARFILREFWCAAGDDKGYIHVFDLRKMEIKNIFKAGGGGSVQSMAIHPTYPYLLSMCKGDEMIEIWDWQKGWTCSQKVQTGFAMELVPTFNTMDPNTFFTVDKYAEIKVWPFNPSAHQPFTSLFTFDEDAGQNHVVTVCSLDTLHVWDLQKGSRVHKFIYDRGGFTAAACHPTLPLIAASVVDLDRYDSGVDAHPDICFWNSTNYRLEKTVRITSVSWIKHLRFVGPRRLVIGSGSEIQVLELIDLDSLACQQ